MRFLVTRPQPECRRTSERLRAAGHIADEAPVLACEEIPPARLDLAHVSALAFSSPRAIAALAGHDQSAVLQALPVFAVGKSTAEAAQRAGYTTVWSADGDIAALAELILGHQGRLETGSVLYPAAADRAGDLGELLTGGNMSCRTVAIYRMKQVDSLPAGVLEVLRGDGYDGCLIYSRRTAQAFLALLEAGLSNHVFHRTTVYALSEQAGALLSGTLPVQVALAPNENALLDLALTQC